MFSKTTTVTLFALASLMTLGITSASAGSFYTSYLKRHHAGGSYQNVCVAWAKGAPGTFAGPCIKWEVRWVTPVTGF